MKRAIAGQRGSVRGAPPEVYIGFSSVEDDDDAEHWNDTFRLFKLVLFVWPLTLLGIIFLLICFLSLITKPLQDPIGLGPFH